MHKLSVVKKLIMVSDMTRTHYKKENKKSNNKNISNSNSKKLTKDEATPEGLFSLFGGK